MLNNLSLNKTLWILTAVLSFFAALIGLVRPGVYDRLVDPGIMPGVLSQDIMTIAASVLIMYIAVTAKEGDSKKQIVVIGLLGYIFYAYGIYVIERFYNVFYFLYMAIFTLTLYSVVYSVASIRREIFDKAKVSQKVRKISVGFSLVIPLMFYALWVGMLLPLIRTGEKIEFMYSIYILDMCFILPAFIIIAVMALKNKGFGLLLLPILFIKGFTLLFSVGLGALFRPLYNLPSDVGEVLLYLGVSAVFLVLTVFYLRHLNIGERTC